MHARAQLQAVFEDWVASGGPWTGAPALDPLNGAHVPSERLLERLGGCADTMSPRVCRALGLDPEASFSEGVAALRAGAGPGSRY
jgi:hypothetical protein